MDIYVARQPIFDENRNLYGYELLYRQSQNNFYEGTDDNQSTASLLSSSFLFMDFDDLIGGTKGFINFSEELLLREIPTLLPPDKVVVEVLERVSATPHVIEACRRLKKKGYVLALDDFDPDAAGPAYEELIALADLIKLEYSVLSKETQAALIRKHRKSITFLAERIETEEEYLDAIRMGYSLFQGYFFSKPIMRNSTSVDSLNTSLLYIIDELQGTNPHYDVISKIIEKDMGLTYKLLKISNSIHFGSKYPIKSITQAISRLGLEKLKQWAYLMLLRGVETHDNAELIKTSVVRGKMMSLLAPEIQLPERESDYFIAGLFSSLDSILNQSMASIVKELPLEAEVKDALVGEPNEIRFALDSVLAFEKARWKQLDLFTTGKCINRSRYMELYLESVKWQKSFAG